MSNKWASKDCPKCTGVLELIKPEKHLQLHRCNRCHAVWCGEATLKLLLPIWMSDAIINTGNPLIGRRFNKITLKVPCPDGHGQMAHKHDALQSHIGYEYCHVCHGIYLDAGEFTDLKHYTIVDRVGYFRPNARKGAVVRHWL